MNLFWGQVYTIFTDIILITISQEVLKTVMAPFERYIVIVLLTFLSILPAPSRATLGETVTSIQSDVDSMDDNQVKEAKHVSRQTSVIKKSNFDIHEFPTRSGHLREYVNGAGEVFAVSWKGEQPDLSKIFGRHYDEFSKKRQAHLKSQGMRNRFHNIQTSEITVIYGGHMKNLKGLAILRSKLPAGVQADELQ